MSMMDRFGFATDNGLGSLARWLRFVYLTLPEDEEEIEEEIAIQRVRRIGRRARVQRPARSARVTSKLLEMVAYEWMDEGKQETSEPASAVPLRRARPRPEPAPFRRSTRQKILNRAERQWSERTVPGQRLAERQATPERRVRRSSHLAWSQSNLVFAQGPQHVEGPDEVEQVRQFGLGSTRSVSRSDNNPRPIERALRQIGRTQSSPAFAVLQDLATVSKGAQRRSVERLLEYTQTLDPDTQETTIRRQLSRLQGPLVVSARAELASPSQKVTRPIGRAASRMLPIGSPKRRFGPVLSSSPSFVVLTHEPEETAPIEKIAGGRVAPLRSSEQLRATGAYDKPVQARVLRQARSQESAGRAGPLPLVADATFEKGSARPIRRRRPTEWVSQLSVDSVQNTILPGSRKGLDAVRPVPNVPSATDHVVRRAESRPVFGVGRIRPASISETSGETLRSSIRRFTQEGPAKAGRALSRAGSRGFRPRISRAAISGIPTAYVLFTPPEQPTDERQSWPSRAPMQRFRGRSRDPQLVSPSLENLPIAGAPETGRLADRIDARRTELGTIPSLTRVARQKQVSRERQSRMRLAAPDFATLAPVRPEQVEDIAYSEPSVRAFNRGRIPNTQQRTTLFEAPMAHAASLDERSIIVPRTVGYSVTAPQEPVRRFTEPTVRAAQRGRAAAPLSRRSGLWRMSVPMRHIEADVPTVSASEEPMSTPMNRAALRSVSVPAYDSRGGRRASPNVTGHVYSAQRVRTLQPSLGGPDAQEGRRRIGQKTIARIPERATAGTTVSSQFRGGLRAVPTAYLQAEQPLQQSADQRLRISVYGVRRPSELSRRAELIRDTDGTGAGRLLPNSVPRPRPRTGVSVMSLPSAPQQDGGRLLGAVPRLRPFGGIRVPQTEFLSFSEPSDFDGERANPARNVARRQRLLAGTSAGRVQEPLAVRSGSMAYASARLSLQAPQAGGPSKVPSMDSNTTRLRQRVRRHKGLLPAPTSYVIASEDTSWLDEPPVRKQGQQGPLGEPSGPARKSHLQWTKTVGRHGDSRPSTSTYVGTLRLAFGTGSQRAIEGDIPSWAERAAHGDLSTLGAARRQKTMQSASIQRLVNSQSVEQMLGVLAQHRRSLEEISEFLPGKAAKVLDQLVNLDPNAIQRSRRQETDTRIESDSAGRGNGRKTVQQTTLSGPRRSGPSGAGGGRASHLANQLLKLIHLAEVERRVDDAHKEVRMSQHEPGASSTAGGDADGAQKATAVRMRELYADVTQEVMLILEQNSKRENY